MLNAVDDALVVDGRLVKIVEREVHVFASDFERRFQNVVTTAKRQRGCGVEDGVEPVEKRGERVVRFFPFFFDDDLAEPSENSDERQ